MAWNPSPQVAVARDFGKTFKKDIVIVFSVDPEGRCGYASYGKTPVLCDLAGQLADRALVDLEGHLAEIAKRIEKSGLLK